MFHDRSVARVAETVCLAALTAVSVLIGLPAFAGPSVAIAATPPASSAMVGAPVIKAIKVTPALVGAGGGMATVTAKLTQSAACQLTVISKPLFRVSVPKQQSCKTTFTAYLKLGANPTFVKRSAALDLVASRGKYSSKALLYVSLAPKRPRPPATTPRTTTATTTTTTTSTTAVPPVLLGGSPPPPPSSTTTPSTIPTATLPPSTTTTSTTTSTTTTSTPPVSPPPGQPMMEQVQSQNWSGYALTGGPFNGVSGTFTVPYLESDETCQTAESQWVGLDGFLSNYLIQAGVGEDTGGGAPCTAPGSFYVYAWWEVITPTDLAPAVPVPVSVKPGDTMTVTIDATGNSNWEISLRDDTSGGSFSTSVAYAGPAGSVEWITESATQPAVCGGVCPLTGYTPPVSFSQLQDANGSVSAVDAITMVQGPGDVPVSVPSPVASLAALLASGFTTSFE